MLHNKYHDIYDWYYVTVYKSACRWEHRPVLPLLIGTNPWFCRHWFAGCLHSEICSWSISTWSIYRKKSISSQWYVGFFLYMYSRSMVICKTSKCITPLHFFSIHISSIILTNAYLYTKWNTYWIFFGPGMISYIIVFW